MNDDFPPLCSGKSTFYKRTFYKRTFPPVEMEAFICLEVFRSGTEKKLPCFSIKRSNSVLGTV